MGVEPLAVARGVQEFDATQAERAELRLQIESSTATLAPERLASLLTSADAGVRRLAATAALRANQAVEADLLAPFFRTADLSELRFAVERANRPLDPALAPLLVPLLGRPEPEAREIAGELAARLHKPLSEKGLVTILGSSGGVRSSRPGLLERLGRTAGSDRSFRLLATHLVDADPGIREAAAAALRKTYGRLLASGQAEAARDLVRLGCLHSPDDPGLLLQDAQTLGLYLDRPRQGRERIARLLRRTARLEQSGPDREGAGALLGQAVIEFFAGRPEEALRSLGLARWRIGRPDPHAREAATLNSRIHLVTAALLIATDADQVSIQTQFEAALLAAPFHPEICLFDQAMLGDFGPLVVLDRLRRTGRDGSRLRFYELLEQALWDDRAELHLGIPIRAAEQEPPPGSDEAAAENNRVRSWVPWWRMRALFQSGHLDQARAVGERVVHWLQNTNLWDNRDLAAQSSHLLGRIHSRAGRPGPAVAALEEAIAILEEIDQATARADLGDRRGRFRAGQEPYRSPFRVLLARARVDLADVQQLLRDRPAPAVELIQRAARDAPHSDLALLALARTVLVDEDPRRAERILESLPREADLLAGLARLAAALGRDALAAELFATHVRWNALTPERQTIEADWRRRILPEAE